MKAGSCLSFHEHLPPAASASPHRDLADLATICSPHSPQFLITAWLPSWQAAHAALLTRHTHTHTHTHTQPLGGWCSPSRPEHDQREANQAWLEPSDLQIQQPLEITLCSCLPVPGSPTPPKSHSGQRGDCDTWHSSHRWRMRNLMRDHLRLSLPRAARFSHCNVARGF